MTTRSDEEDALLAALAHQQELESLRRELDEPNAATKYLLDYMDAFNRQFITHMEKTSAPQLRNK